MIMTQHVPPTEAGAEALPSSSHETYWVERGVPVSEVCKQETNYKKHLTAVFPTQVFLASAKSCGFFFFRVFS